MGVADEGRVVAPDEGAVERRADAGIRLRPDHDQVPDAEPREHVLQRGVLERVAVALLDERLVVARAQLRDDAPRVGAALQVLAVVLHPDDRHLLPACSLDQPGDVGDHGVPLVRALDDAVLHVDHEDGGVGSVSQRGHGSNLETGP